MMLRLRKTESETIILTLSNSNLAHHACKWLDLNFQSQLSSRAVGSEGFSRPEMMALLPEFSWERIFIIFFIVQAYLVV